MPHRLGGTRWKRFVLVLLPSLAAAGALGISMAQGVLAASFLLSGQRFKIAAGSVTSHGVAQYGFVDVTRNGVRIPVAVTSARHAVIHRLCQSALIPLGPLGTYTLKITAGRGDRPVTAEDLVTDSIAVSASDATYRHFDDGVAAGAVTRGKVHLGGAHWPLFDPNGLAQQAVSLTQTNFRTIAVAVSAEYFDLPGLKVTLVRNGHECF